MNGHHSWEKIRIHHYVCRKCGAAKRNIPDGRIFIATFVRGDQFAERLTPPCDSVWPRGWTEEMAEAEMPSGATR